MHHGTPGDDFDNGMLQFIQNLKLWLAYSGMFAAAFLVLYCAYLVIGSVIFLVYALL